MGSLLTSVFRDPRLQRIRRLNQFGARRLGKLQSALPDITCVDVGASYYPHTSWWLFMDSPRTAWLAVEPNRQNLGYVDAWPWAASVTPVPVGLSEHGGPQTLHVTNTDSGSSLLKPVIGPAMESRATEQMRNYFFPVTEVEIMTQTLASVISEYSAGPNVPTVVKLDTQGSELSILKSVLRGNSPGNLVGVEIECSLLASPYYESSPRLWEVAQFMEQHGFELIQVDIVPRVLTKSKISSKAREIANESDAVFALRPEVAQSRPVEFRAALLAFYITNCFYGEAVRLLSNDRDLVGHLGSRGCNISRLTDELTRRSR